MSTADQAHSAPARPVQITSADLAAYNARQRELGRKAVLLGERKRAASAATYRCQSFISHRYATARSAIATERYDAFFAERTWGYDSARAERRAALYQYLRVIRSQIARARADRASSVVTLAKAA
tara:strand:+ start:238 stop:612 length:375 start_codon:yes stop_codon:yes gene_type:complete